MKKITLLSLCSILIFSFANSQELIFNHGLTFPSNYWASQQIKNENHSSNVGYNHQIGFRNPITKKWSMSAFLGIQKRLLYKNWKDDTFYPSKFILNTLDVQIEYSVLSFSNLEYIAYLGSSFQRVNNSNLQTANLSSEWYGGLFLGNAILWKLGKSTLGLHFQMYDFIKLNNPKTLSSQARVKDNTFALGFSINYDLTKFETSILKSRAKENLPNTIFLELGGHGFVYNFTYERLLFKSDSYGLYGQIGVSVYSLSSGIRPLWIPITISHQLNLHPNHKIEFGFGKLISYDGDDYSDWFGNRNFKSNDWIFRLGYRYEPNTGKWVYRIGFTPYLLEDRDFIPFGGLSIGRKF